MTRMRYNGLSTAAAPVSLGASLTNSGTTITFNAALTYLDGTAVPTLTGTQYIPLAILNPGRNAAREVVWLTAYTSGATTGTIGRGKESTVGVAHDSGDLVVHGPTVDDVGFIGVKAYRSGATTFANGSGTDFNWDAEEWDTHGFHDNTTNSNRLTVPVGQAGKYHVDATLASSQLIAGRFSMTLYKNATMVRGGLNETVGGTAFATANVSTDVDLAEGDYVRLVYYQNAGASINVDTAASAFSMHKIG